MTEQEEIPERDEQLVGQLTRIDDAIRRQGVNPQPVMPAVEELVKAMDGMPPKNQRRVVDGIKEGLSDGGREYH